MLSDAISRNGDSKLLIRTFSKYFIFYTYTHISASAEVGLPLLKFRKTIVYGQLWFFLWTTANSHHTCLHYNKYTCDATVHLATCVVYPFGCYVVVPFCNCTGVTTMNLAAAVCFSRKGVPSAITVWVILKRGYVFNLTQLFNKNYW